MAWTIFQPSFSSLGPSLLRVDCPPLQPVAQLFNDPWAPGSQNENADWSWGFQAYLGGHCTITGLGATGHEQIHIQVLNTCSSSMLVLRLLRTHGLQLQELHHRCIRSVCNPGEVGVFGRRGLSTPGTAHSQNATKGLPAFRLSEYWIFSWGGWSETV